MPDVTVLGGGAFGTALAVLLGGAGRKIVLALRRPDHLAETLRVRENPLYLPGVPLPPAIELTDRWDEAVRCANFVVMAVPSKFARAMLLPLVEVIPADAVIVNVAKGIEETSLKTMSEMLADIAPRVNKVAVLSGPGFAAELAAGRPAAMVAAAASDAIARGVQALFSTRTLRIYRSRDVVGVELAGTVKNVIAIAAGISDGLDLGSSARAGLITRGIAELMRLVRAAGGSAETVAGLAGVGDLVLTCTGVLSRNRSVGLSLARGERPSGSTNGRPVAEGITNARAVYQLAERLGVEMPIVTAVYRVLYEDASASGMVDELLSRELKAEFGH